MGRRKVQLTDDALDDLDEIHAYISEHDGDARADRILDGIGASLEKLSTSPARGEFPKELLDLGIRQFRQVHYKPYRMVYQFDPKSVSVMLIADGRRDMQTLLQRRLFAAR